MVNDEVIKAYFSTSGFNDNLVLDLVCTNVNFEHDYSRFIVDFSMDIPEFVPVDTVVESLETQCIDAGKRYLRIRVRRNELFDVIRNRKPWEDLSIGFQCRIYRNPNVYNSDFWFHFTNKCIG